MWSDDCVLFCKWWWRFLIQFQCLSCTSFIFYVFALLSCSSWWIQTCFELVHLVAKRCFCLKFKVVHGHVFFSRCLHWVFCYFGERASHWIVYIILVCSSPHLSFQSHCFHACGAALWQKKACLVKNFARRAEFVEWCEFTANNLKEVKQRRVFLTLACPHWQGRRQGSQDSCRVCWATSAEHKNRNSDKFGPAYLDSAVGELKKSDTWWHSLKLIWRKPVSKGVNPFTKELCLFKAKPARQWSVSQR